jgi:hypothetical protein
MVYPPKTKPSPRRGNSSPPSAKPRRIIAGLVERIPAIEAPAETPEAYDEAAEEASGRVESQEGVQLPWCKRVFRG